MTSPYVPGPEQADNLPSHTAQWLPTEPPKKSRKTLWIVLGVVGALLLVLCCGGVIASAGSDPDTKPTVAPSTRPTTPPTTRVPTTPSTVAPSPTTANPEPSEDVTDNPPPVGLAKTKEPELKFEKLTARKWKLIAKNPENYKGKTYVVYGVVTQFDTATGQELFLANVDGVRRPDTYDYSTNTFLGGDAYLFDDLVEDDEFRAEVVVAGSTSYDTQIGGNTTVPLLGVFKLKRY